MVTSRDGLNSPRLHGLRRSIAAILAALCLAGCSRSGLVPEQVSAPRPWPPDKPRQASRLESPFSPGSDPLVWWKSTFFDTLPAGIYRDTLAAQVASAVIEETNEARADN